MSNINIFEVLGRMSGQELERVLDEICAEVDEEVLAPYKENDNTKRRTT